MATTSRHAGLQRDRLRHRGEALGEQHAFVFYMELIVILTRTPGRNIVQNAEIVDDDFAAASDSIWRDWYLEGQGT